MTVPPFLPVRAASPGRTCPGASRPGVFSFIGAIFALAALAAGPAAAQGMLCFPRDMAIAAVEGGAQTPAAVAATLNGAGEPLALEVFSGAGGDYTILLTGSDGVSCILSRGGRFAIVRGRPS